MKFYHKSMACFSYLFGIMALLAVLVDDRHDPLYSFHIWQALLLNILIAVLAILAYVFWLPQHLMLLGVAERAGFFLKAILIPLVIGLLFLLMLGSLAATEIKFKIPVLGKLANTMVYLRGR